MRARDRFSSAAWRCFWTDVRRRWQRKSFSKALALFVAGAAILLSLGLMAFRAMWSSSRLGSDAWQWVWRSSWALGLLTPPFSLAPDILNQASQTTRAYLLVDGTVALLWLACRVLMPAYAATSIAPDREQRRIGDLILAGLTPRQILLAKGLASVLPFLLLAFATSVVWTAAYALAFQPEVPAHIWVYGDLPSGVTFLNRVALPFLSLLLSMAIQVCISAMVLRTSHAVALCYALEWLLSPAIYLGSVFWPGATLLYIQWNGWILVPQLSLLLVWGILLAILWPRAVRALAYPDEGVTR